MKKTINRSAIAATAFLLFALFAMNLTSCKKKEEKKTADFVVGDYIGSGTNANDDPFIQQIIRIVKITNDRIRVEPVGHTNIAAFEIDIDYIDGNVVGVDGNTGLVVTLEDLPQSLSFDKPNGESFAGFIQ